MPINNIINKVITICNDQIIVSLTGIHMILTAMNIVLQLITIFTLLNIAHCSSTLLTPAYNIANSSSILLTLA